MAGVPGGHSAGVTRLHQMFQWHHMVSDTDSHPVETVRGLEVNTLADGFFHLATWLFVAAGLVLMLRAWQRGVAAPTWRFQLGSLLVGWGLFTSSRGPSTGVHHVRDDLGGPLSWDLAFLALGCAQLLGGLALSRAGARSVARPTA